MSVRPIPEGYHAVTPYLVVHDAARALNFYRRAFGAVEVMRLDMPGGRIGHAEIKVGDSHIMLADEFPESGFRSPQAYGGTPVSILLYVEDVDRGFEQAVAAGARAVRPVEDQFYGDRTGTLEDPFGHLWTLATHTQDVSVEEVRRRFADWARQQGAQG
jgi:PhnB protein